jgi:hypothetical protein
VFSQHMRSLLLDLISANGKVKQKEVEGSWLCLCEIPTHCKCTIHQHHQSVGLNARKASGQPENH